MKKEYNTPKAEKIDFDYVETVVASEGAKPESVPATPLQPASIVYVNWILLDPLCSPRD